LPKRRETSSARNTGRGGEGRFLGEIAFSMGFAMPFSSDKAKNEVLEIIGNQKYA
jgi:hypothetical protein